MLKPTYTTDPMSVEITLTAIPQYTEEAAAECEDDMDMILCKVRTHLENLVRDIGAHIEMEWE